MRIGTADSAVVVVGDKLTVTGGSAMVARGGVRVFPSTRAAFVEVTAGEMVLAGTMGAETMGAGTISRGSLSRTRFGSGSSCALADTERVALPV